MSSIKSILRAIIFLSLSFVIGCFNASRTDTPSWFWQPPFSPDYLYAVSTAVGHNTQQAIDDAATSARAELATQISVRISTLVKSYAEEIGEEDISSVFSMVTRAVSSVDLVSTRIAEIHYRKEGNLWRVYVLVELPIDTVNSRLLRQVKTDNAIYERLMIESETFRELQEALEKHDLDEFDYMAISFDSTVPGEMKVGQQLVINGQKVQIDAIDEDTRILQIKYLSGASNPIRNGLNTISSAKRKFLFWQEEKKLKPFEEPYRNSYAILIAIDDYDKVNDSENRERTGFEALSFMVEHAEKLKQILQNLGFPAENIQTFYDEEATSGAIEDELELFWKGGDKASVDRLFFYFGGHGYVDKDDDGYLVTYDYNPKKYVSTTLSMTDLITRQAQHIGAHHMIVALDSCYSGLALRYLSDDIIDEERLKKFETLNAIRSAVEPKARNVLLAGTEDQKALSLTGGIFTQALIDGLQGEADWNKDGVIEFDELYWLVRRRVEARANMVGVKQTPKSSRLTHFGSGSVVFLLPPEVVR